MGSTGHLYCSNPVSFLFFPLHSTQFDIADYQIQFILTSVLSSGTRAGWWRKLYIILRMGNYIKWNQEHCITNKMHTQAAFLVCQGEGSFSDKNVLGQFFNMNREILNQKSVESIWWLKEFNVRFFWVVWGFFAFFFVFEGFRGLVCFGFSF